MMQNKILDASGKELVMLGGPFMHKQFVKGDITVELTWVDEEPHMLLYRAVPTTKTGAFMIDMADAHKYADSRSGGPSRTLMSDCIKGAAAIGFSPTDKFAVIRLMDAILDTLPDLIAMPPEPKASQKVNAPVSGENELAIQVNGKTVIEALV